MNKSQKRSIMPGTTDKFSEAENATSLMTGLMTVKFQEDSNGKIFSSAKTDIKVRYCELVINKGKGFLLVYKIKKGDKMVPYFKVDIDSSTRVVPVQVHPEGDEAFKHGFHLGSEHGIRASNFPYE